MSSASAAMVSRLSCNRTSGARRCKTTASSYDLPLLGEGSRRRALAACCMLWTDLVLSECLLGLLSELLPSGLVMLSELVRVRLNCLRCCAGQDQSLGGRFGLEDIWANGPHS